MTLAEELIWRGLVQKSTFDQIGQLDAQRWVFYIGFDASAPSQTVGNLAAMMAARVFLRHGQRAILLAGGATSLVGDPGGKEAERELLDIATIAQNIDNAVGQFKTVFADFQDQIIYVNNLDWYKDFKLLDFLRDVGKNFSITPLIQRDFIASRLGAGGSGISYAEFSYTLLQGYDYLKLFEDHGCSLQLGGSDQWGNCLSGVDLIRRKHQTAVHALTLPLIINKATGKKFGKSEDQTVWLDPALSHPSDFYQFWLNAADEDAGDYLKVFTEAEANEIEEIIEAARQKPQTRPMQKQLADRTTRLVHGEKWLRICQIMAALAFGEASAADFEPIADQPDEYQLLIDSQTTPSALIDQLIDKTASIDSRGQLKSLLGDGGLKVVCQTDEGLTRQTPATADELAKLLLDGHRRPLLIIAGKNTLRAVKYSDRNS